MRRAAVLGAGLAGLAAAIDLAEAGVKVTIYERRPYAGGRVYSFVDSKTGDEVDNGQHVFLSCCPVFCQFIRKLGIEHEFVHQTRMEIPFFDARTGRRFVFREARPIRSLLGLKHLGLREKWRIARTIQKTRRIDPWRDPGLERMTFADWLRANGATDRAIGEFWDVFVLAAINLSSERAAAAPCLFTFRDAFSKGLDASRVGYPRRGLSCLAEAALAHLQQLGATIELNRCVRSIGETVDLVDGTRVSADAIVSAIPQRALWRVLSEDLKRHDFFAPLEKLGTSPIVGINLWYDRPAGDFDFAAVVGGPIPWIFNRSRILGLRGCMLHIPLSAARQPMTTPKGLLIERFDRACRQLLPELKGAQLIHSLVVREAHATIEWTPGANVLRRPHKTPLSSLFLAGDWTDVGWPSTMEGALRSGHAAAQAVLERLFL